MATRGVGRYTYKHHLIGWCMRGKHGDDKGTRGSKMDDDMEGTTNDDDDTPASSLSHTNDMQGEQEMDSRRQRRGAGSCGDTCQVSTYQCPYRCHITNRCLPPELGNLASTSHCSFGGSRVERH